MSNLFYKHLVIIDDIVAVFDEHKVTPHEKEDLLAMVHETLHHHILDTVLTHLPRKHHETFLEKITSNHPEILGFLREKTKVDIEKEIRRTIERVTKMILRDIKTK